MKQKKILSTAIFLLVWLPQLLFAQKSDVFSKMKPGDWFEVLVSDTARKSNDESWRYHIKYLLKKINSEGSKEYTLTFERIRVILSSAGHAPLGYDSYYPPYQQGIQQKLVKPSFTAQVDKTGKVLSMKPQTDFPKINLQEIASRKTYGGSSVEMEPVHAETASVISQIILEAIARGEKDWVNGRLYKDSELSFLISGATFPLADNVVLEGKISNMTQQVKDGLDLYLPGTEQPFRISKDGSFRITAFLTEGSGGRLKYRYPPKETSEGRTPQIPLGADVVLSVRELNMPLFFQPGDTLRITADANDFVNSMQVTGNAAGMASFGLELAKIVQHMETAEIPYGVKSFSAGKYMKAQNADESAFGQLNAQYRGKLTAGVLKYHKLKFAFEEASGRLDFLSKTSFKATPEAPVIFEDFPLNFFKGIDTLPVLMIDYNQAGWYHSFLNSLHVYLSFKAGQLNGGSDDFFLGDYVLSLNYLKRYPLYATLAEAFENELGSSNWKSAQTLKPYYDDFIDNCGDTALTNRVSGKWRAISSWAPGNQLPLKKIRLSDGRLLDINKFKGKALSMTFNFHYPDEMKRLLERIKKQDPNKVHFLIVQLKEDGYTKSTVAEELKKLPQVTYVEVTRDNDDLEDIVLLTNWDVKTFVIDAEQRIIQDNIDDSPERLSQDKAFEEALKKALAPKTMSKEDKAELIKTIGWSLGSILFASLIFFWIYKVRIASLERKENIKRQINELEIKAIRSQMNPHFLFNALNSIQSLINNNQYKEANFYLEKFSLLMRRVLNNSEKIFITLSDELEAVTLYAELEKLRFNFHFNINVEDAVNTNLIEIPGMIIQPLIENAIVHGLAQKGISGKLEISIRKEKAYLNITVKDNGKGLTTNPESHNGFGLKLVKERLNLLNTGGANGKLTLNSNLGENNTGVTAVLIIPID
jgi:two-component sensor histidine kinase